MEEEAQQRSLPAPSPGVLSLPEEEEEDVVVVVGMEDVDDDDFLDDHNMLLLLLLLFPPFCRQGKCTQHSERSGGSISLFYL